VSAAADWLRARLADAPPALLERMVAALPEDGEVPEALAAGAMSLYEQVLRGTGGREDALPLLAADALLTHALEARAEMDADGMGEFAEAWGGAGRIGVLAEG
jgi:hypothetical protein